MSKLVSSRPIAARPSGAEAAGQGPARLSRVLTEGTANRRRLLGWLAVGGLGSAVLTACGNNEVGLADEDVTRTTDVQGAPPPPTEAPAVAQGGAATPAAQPAADGAAPAAGGEVTISAWDIGWEYNGQRTAVGAPIDVPVAPGTVITVPNTGAAAHNFSVDAFGISQDLPPGATEQVTIPADAAPGTYEFYCNVPGHKQAGQVGNLVVGAAAPAAAGGEQPAAPAEGQAAAPAPAGGGVTIEAHDIYWAYNGQQSAPGAPIDVPVAAGQTITIPNEGAAAHDFVVDDWGIQVHLDPGQSGTAQVPADATGTHKFYCSIPGHEQAGMVGNLVIQ